MIHPACKWLLAAAWLGWAMSPAAEAQRVNAQSVPKQGISNQGFGNPGTKPRRAVPPVFEDGQFEGIFFADPAGQLSGPRPAATSEAARAVAESGPAPSPAAAPVPEVAGTPASAAGANWSTLISPTSLEDLVKGSKLRLDRSVTTPTAFKGGGFRDARVEFSLQAVLFAIIESYPDQVRWQRQAAEARQRFARVAANTKVGSDQVFAEAKARLLDLGDLIGGGPLAGSSLSGSGEAEIEWSKLIDRGPLMQLLQWAHEQNLSKLVANPAEFQQNHDAVLRYAELIAILGRVALADDMPDASDGDYQALAGDMVEQARQVVTAVTSNNAELARSATAQLGQACINCHDSFR